MCSQPIEHEAQLSRATPRASARSSAASRGASLNVAAWKLRVGSVLMALKARRFASVPSSRYFAVAGPNERFLRSRAAARTPFGSAGATFVAGRAGARPRAGGADRAHAPRLPEPLAQAPLGLVGAQAPQVPRGLDPRAVAVDQQHR